MAEPRSKARSTSNATVIERDPLLKELYARQKFHTTLTSHSATKRKNKTKTMKNVQFYCEEKDYGSDLSRERLRSLGHQRDHAENNLAPQLRRSQNTPYITSFRCCFVAVSKQIQWRSRFYSSSSSGSVTGILEDLWQPRARFRDSVRAQRLPLSITSAESESQILIFCAQHTESCKIGHEDGFGQNKELSKDSGFVTFLIHHQVTIKQLLLSLKQRQ